MSSSSSIGTWSGRGFYPTTFSAQTTRGMANQWHHNHESRQRGLDGLRLAPRRHREDRGVNTPIHSSGLSISSTIPWSICRNHASWHRSGLCDWEDVSSGSSIWLPSLLCGRYLLELLSLKRLTEEIDNGGCRAGACAIPSVPLSIAKRASGQPNSDKAPRRNSFLIRRSPSTMTSKNTTPVRCARSRFSASSTLRILSWPMCFARPHALSRHALLDCLLNLKYPRPRSGENDRKLYLPPLRLVSAKDILYSRHCSNQQETRESGQ